MHKRDGETDTQATHERAEQRLSDFTANIAKRHTLGDLVADILATCNLVFEAKRSALFLYDPTADELFLETGNLGVSTDERSKMRFSANLGIAGAAFQSGQRVVVPDAYADSRVNLSVDDATGIRTRNILCVPLIGPEGPLGVLEFLDRPAATLGPWEHTLLDRFTQQVVVAIHSLSFPPVHGHPRKRDNARGVSHVIKEEKAATVEAKVHA